MRTSRDERCVLIGTPDSVELLRRQLDLLPEAPTPIGAVLVGDDGPPGHLMDLGGLGELESVCRAHRPAVAVVSLPGALAGQEREIRAALARCGVRTRVVPPLDELLSREPLPIAARRAQTVDLATLVGRRAHPVDRAQLERLLGGSRVLITGAGGSIGSEIARLCASFEPALLVLADRSENAVFEIDRTLGGTHRGVPRRAVLHDVVDRDATRVLVEQTQPDLIFHAAAHKHVPLMEDHPSHALTNNFFGTRSIADAAVSAGVRRFVLISSDKAVNPTSVMGATKRLAEMYVQGLGRRGGGATQLSMVRFGNVLGSACSVLPIWESQIAEGGPVTVTDTRMTRYFMTIPEAAGLVVHAASLSTPAQAEVFVLDMGEPVSILELAKRFVRAHGLEPVVGSKAGAWNQTEIRLTGIRPGEKLHEELAYDVESLRPTAHPGIMALRDAWAPDEATLAAMVEHLDRARREGSSERVVRAMGRFVPQMGGQRVAA
ncbi:MAG: polysaccharide biosynthesis protein [Leptolyngbya sp. PLA3]|nr:MAG: polysaccharide biosynthesis protein [Cyanobacteria bacterium CYA]MCE7968479.1 polysaccharide biosynthesis protein [Leptolyngbya sp. PL-A3]